MKTILTAIALTIALPAMASAQAAPAPAAKASEHAKMMGMMNCTGMAGHTAGGGHDMAAMKSHMASMTKQDHEKMMLACGKAPAKGATTPSAVHPTHKM